MAHQLAHPKKCNWLKRTAESAALGLSLSFAPLVSSCAIPSPYLAQFQKPRKTISGAHELALVKGASGIDDALKALRGRGVTNIATARGLDALDQKVPVEAITGDFLRDVLLFKNGKYHSSLAIGADAGEAKEMHLHIAHAEGTNAVIIVGNDISRQGFPSVFVLLERLPPKRYFISHGNFPGAETGIYDPRMVGDDLGGTGVTFVWRDFHGMPAEYGVILKCDGKKLEITKIGMQKLLGCECIYDWYNAKHSK